MNLVKTRNDRRRKDEYLSSTCRLRIRVLDLSSLSVSRNAGRRRGRRRRKRIISNNVSYSIVVRILSKLQELLPGSGQMKWRWVPYNLVGRLLLNSFELRMEKDGLDPESNGKLIVRKDVEGNYNIYIVKIKYFRNVHFERRIKFKKTFRQKRNFTSGSFRKIILKIYGTKN